MPRSLTRELAAHFTGCEPAIRQIYELIVERSRAFGSVSEEPKKTSIHLVNRSAFAGVQTRKKHLILTLKSATEIPSSRFFKKLHTSANRWYLETKLDSPEMVDGELIGWLKAAHKISG
jgi:hypothetical protein